MEKIKTYDRIKDQDENLIPGLKFLVVPISAIKEDGSFTNYKASTAAYIDSPSVTLIIEDRILDYLDSMRLVFDNNSYSLFMKEGETLNLTKETPEEKEIRELKERLAQLEKNK